MRGERILFRATLCIAHNLSAFEQLFYLLQVVFADDVGGYDEPPVGMLAEEGYEDVFVGLPAAAGHEDFWLFASLLRLIVSILLAFASRL